ncbi:MAG: 30S ribosomal protein S8 [Nevskiaceae bacterium]|nr:MAG: 30S ribosomal protein S8 [Nevskiaceae bacterium]TBR72962.1 MAG: 30S ribosomal protein S8 [Nevskiaceae bacterium]
MSMSDSIGDFLTRIRNAQAAHKKQIVSPSSKQKAAIAQLLKDEGYISDFRVTAEGVKHTIVVDLKYFEGKPVIDRLERVSKPSLRIYKRCEDLPRVLGGLGVVIVSTSKGLLSDRQARADGVGGEIICRVA